MHDSMTVEANSVLVIANLNGRRLEGAYGSAWDAAGAISDFAHRRGYRIEYSRASANGVESGYFVPVGVGAPTGDWIFGPRPTV
ncbi:hypothetical protein SSEA_SKINNY_160 [Mycobacterium phage Skinny]|nr:hypothetical protein FDH95_gp094 [Mycobacterium phage Bongo]ALF00664.1 hypothetical protein SEA_BRICOLE_158 [Mycobacterium phage Bricole]QDH93708.1 hypothetical protein SEA_LILHOMIEP_152 [Mycobacterium phage LilhomieP]QUU29336.1 hypothetical protein [Mycobacterium phage SirSheldon]UXE05327.1 hypothetical protein SSEA_SKINNY_160 [Mycobacterium phage Skinny]WNN95709.1 hypothetical protein SEA_GLASKE16_155 [Mycobacterium phage Glaske16]WNN96300.1 hypothetical protein SEA_DULCITA_153 [Mycobact